MITDYKLVNTERKTGGIHQDLQQCHAQSHVLGRGNA